MTEIKGLDGSDKPFWVTTMIAFESKYFKSNKISLHNQLRVFVFDMENQTQCSIKSQTKKPLRFAIDDNSPLHYEYIQSDRNFSP